MLFPRSEGFNFLRMSVISLGFMPGKLLDCFFSFSEDVEGSFFFVVGCDGWGACEGGGGGGGIGGGGGGGAVGRGGGGTVGTGGGGAKLPSMCGC